MNEPEGSLPRQGRRPSAHPLQDRTATSAAQRVQRLSVVGTAAIVLVVLLVLVSGPSDLSILRRLFIWFSTLAFTVWLLHENRHRIPVAESRFIFVVGAGALAVLGLALTVTGF